MLIAKQSMIISEQEALKSMIKFYNNTDTKGIVNELEERLNNSTKLRNNKTSTARSLALSCLENNTLQALPGSNQSDTTSQSKPCTQYKTAQDDAVTATFQQAQVNSDYQSTKFMLNSENQFNEFLSDRIEYLEEEMAGIAAELNSSTEVYLGGLADSTEFQNLNSILSETEQNLDNNWMQFEYDSDSNHLNTDQDTTSKSIAAGIGVGAPGISGFDAHASYGKGTTDLDQALNSASLKVSGSVLRVVIKRPWFKPSLFEDPSLSFVSIATKYI